ACWWRWGGPCSFSAATARCARGRGAGARAAARAAAVAGLGPASERRDGARPSGRALRVLGGARRAPQPGGGLRGCSRRAVLRLERPAAQPLGRLPLQRPHGAASGAHAAVSAAAPVRHARGGGAAAAPARVGAPGGRGRYAAARRRGALHGADRAVAPPRTLRGSAAPPPAAHRPAPRLPHDGGADVVPGALPGPRAAAPSLRGADAVPVSVGDPDVAGGRAHHPGRPGALPLLRRGPPRLRY